MLWLVYIIIILAASLLVGSHLGRFSGAYGSMVGMMVGMTMGMLNGFVLGYGAAAASSSMFWGNLFGMLLGLLLGSYYGRAGGLLGVLDGALGGVMGGSMGAMLGVMMVAPEWAQAFTAVVLALIHLVGMASLVALAEQNAPHQAADHRLAPLLARLDSGASSMSPWRLWGLVVVPVLLVLAVALLLNATAGPVAPFGTLSPELAAETVTVKLDANGVQTSGLVVHGDTMSYSPRILRVKKGLPVQLNLSIEGRDPG